MPSSDGAELRADVRRLGDLLGETIARQEGQSLLDLVEQVRQAVREDSPAGANLLAKVNVDDSIRLVRAFNAYFHLANVAEQVHRARTLAQERGSGESWLQRASHRIADQKISRDELARAVASLSVRPVFTAHPTEAARRSILSKLATIAVLLDAKNAPENNRRLAEAIELLWQTDELRLERPEPIDEAMNALYYLDDLSRSTVSQVLEDFAFELNKFGITLDATARPLSFGSWIGGDRDGNPHVTAEVTKNLALTDNVAFPWFAAAGYTRGIVSSIKARKKLTQEDRDVLYKGRINPIATFSDVGTVIWGNKTLQIKESALDRINVRRLLLQARKLISAVSVRLLFEQNDDKVRQDFLNAVNPILDGIRRDRGLYDFRVTVSSDTADLDRNQMTGKIYIKPTKSLEFIDITFYITPTGASFENI